MVRAPTVSDAPGYPTGVAGVVRPWDGHAWFPQLSQDPSAPALPAWREQPFAVLTRSPFRLWFAGMVAGVVLAVVSVITTSTFVAGAAGFVGCGAMLAAFVLFVTRKLRLTEAISVCAMIGWGLVAGVVGQAFALPIEAALKAMLGVPNAWQIFLIVGPVEETAKILVPVLLFCFGQYRDPRAGVAIGLVSGALFGLVEGVLFLTRASAAATAALDVGGVNPASPIPVADMVAIVTIALAIARPVMELVHPMLTVFVVAVAWRVAWVTGRFWPAFLGAFAVAAFVHSANDALANGLVAFVVGGIVLVVSYCWMARLAARELTPPHQLGSVPPGWRPKMPPRGVELPAARYPVAESG